MIKVQNLTKSFRIGVQNVEIIKDITFEVEEGNFAVIIGPSGCGKSTLLHTILGLEPPTSGTIQVHGYDLYKNTSEDIRSEFRKRNIGMVYQQPNWIKGLTVVENVAFPLILLGITQNEALKKAGNLLLEIGMDQWVNYTPTELSSGQQQRVSLARALILDPKIIVADEPTGNLDFESGQQLMQLLKELNDKGKTILMVTHDLEYLKYAKTAIKMFNGKIVEVVKGEENTSTIESQKYKRGFNQNNNSTETSIKPFKLNSSFQLSRNSSNKPNNSGRFSIMKYLFQTCMFTLLIFCYLINMFLLKVYFLRIPPHSFFHNILKWYSKFYNKTVALINYDDTDTITKLDLLNLSMKHMAYKKARTLITIGGMAIGIAAIVFLVSIGYGLEKLVISRVARLEEMRQAEISPRVGGNIKINDKSISDFQNLTHVKEVLPVIALVAKVNFNNSVSDMAVYGITSEYLVQSAVQPIYGDIFSNNDTVTTDLAIIDEPKDENIETKETTSSYIIEDMGDWVKIAGLTSSEEQSETIKVAMPSSAVKQAVVNQAMLKILNINETDAVNKKFQVSYMILNELIENSIGKVESMPEEYTIVGVIKGGTTPLFYVPFIDLRSLNISNYSHAKLIADSQENLPKIRMQIENMGYVTSSVADTVTKINNLFNNIRIVLSVLGMVALSVAALGMFNTLTVSLLERTREVGLMKALGMKSSEVQKLFLTESITMGVFGGIAGILLGWLGGKVIGIILSFLSIFKSGGSNGYIDISYLPVIFLSTIIILSMLVGILTGIYPSKRATKISALDALRYE